MSAAASSSTENEKNELMEILSSMGVKLPASTLLPADALQQRLALALDRSQHHAEVVGPGKKPKFRDLQRWVNGRKDLKQAMTSYSLEEMAGKGNEGPFNDLRGMLSNSIALMYGAGIMSYFVVEDASVDRIAKIKARHESRRGASSS